MLNAWLEARCLAQARARAHPEQSDKTVWEVFEAERQSLIEYRGPFDGFREVEVAVSKSSLVRIARRDRQGAEPDHFRGSRRIWPGLSPVCGKPVVARFDGGRLSSDGGILLLTEVQGRLGIAERLARCIEDPRVSDGLRYARPPGELFRLATGGRSDKTSGK